VGAGFYLRIIVKIGHSVMNNNKKRDIPAATLAFLAKSAKAIGNLFASSAHDTPGPNQPCASIMAVSISCTTDIGVDLNDNPYKPMSHGTRIRWTSVACVLLTKYWNRPNSKAVLTTWRSTTNISQRVRKQQQGNMEYL
jgi:hypothetical protein